MPSQEFRNEWEFNQALQDLAVQHGWEQPFHIPAVAYRVTKDHSQPIPAGFPDLLLRYRDVEGKSTILVAELKTDDESSFPTEYQQKFLEDFAQHVPTFVLRPRDWEYIEQILRDGPPETIGQVIEPSPVVVRRKEWMPPQRTIDAIVYRLVEDIRNPTFPRGDLAGLRRMNPREPDTTAFYQLMGARGLLGNQNLETKWALIMHGIALMTPSAHDGGTPVGEALFEGGDPGRTNAFYSDLRLNKLLKARSSMLATLMTQVFRMMNAANQPLDWREMATFILSEGIDENKAEASRRRIARAYYGTEYRKSRARSA